MLGKRSIVVALLAVCLLVPATASAGEEFEGAFGAFTLKASNGFRMFVLASSRHADGRGELLISVGTKASSVLYATGATVTPTGIEADLGELGRIDLEYVPTGVKERVRSRCDDDVASFEKASYQGTFEFRGEEGFTSVSATRIPVDNRFWLDLICGGAGFGETRGGGLPGARLRVLPKHGKASALDFAVRKNRPSARSLLTVRVKERRHGIDISRGMEALVGSAAFDYDPLLRTATVAPPAPFDGSASFHRNAPPASRWTGNLTVDLPGRADVPLSGPGFRVTLVPAHWSKGIFHPERRGRDARRGDFVSTWGTNSTGQRGTSLGLRSNSTGS